MLSTTKTDAILLVLASDCDTPEVLRALVELLAANEDCVSGAHLEKLESLYELVRALSWPDYFEERQDILAQLSFLAWNSSRLRNDYRGTRVWQSRCSKHCLEQDHIRSFFQLSEVETTESLLSRFLADNAVLLAWCARVDEERNYKPRWVAQEVDRLYAWLTRDEGRLGLKE